MSEWMEERKKGRWRKGKNAICIKCENILLGSLSQSDFKCKYTSKDRIMFSVCVEWYTNTNTQLKLASIHNITYTKQKRDAIEIGKIEERTVKFEYVHKQQNMNVLKFLSKECILRNIDIYFNWFLNKVQICNVNFIVKQISSLKSNKLLTRSNHEIPHPADLCYGPVLEMIEVLKWNDLSMNMADNKKTISLICFFQSQFQTILTTHVHRKGTR